MIIQDLKKDKYFISSLIEDNKEYDMNIVEYIFIDNSNYYSLRADYYLFLDVGNMPEYIQKDWIEKNRNKLSLDVLNKHIKEWLRKSDLFSDGTVDKKYTQDVLNNLISIRRDFILKGIL